MDAPIMEINVAAPNSALDVPERSPKLTPKHAAIVTKGEKAKVPKKEQTLKGRVIQYKKIKDRCMIV
jgi:hypothetical protein